MKTNTLLSTMLFAAGMTASVISFAQVKVGTNPVTIEPTSNLEVEASTAGRQMKVNKTTGQVTIKDGTEGAGKVFTSDATGNGSWVAGTASQVNFFATFSGQKAFFKNTPTKINFDFASPNVGNGYDVASDKFTVPVAGIYHFIGAVYVHFDESPLADYGDYLTIKVNDVSKLTQENYQYRKNSGNAFSISYMIRLNQGDVVELYAGSSKPNPRFAGYAYSIDSPQTTFQGFLISN